MINWPRFLKDPPFLKLQHGRLKPAAIYYGLAIVAAAATLSAMYVLRDPLSGIWYTIPVAVLAIIAIFLPASASAVFSIIVGVAAWYFFQRYYNSFLLADYGEAGRLISYFVASFTIILATSLLHQVRRRLEAALEREKLGRQILAESDRIARANEQRLRAIFDNVGVGIVEVNEDDVFISANRHACEILGYRLQDLIGMSVHQLTAPQDRQQSDKINLQLHQGQHDRVDYEKRYLRADGNSLWVHVTVNAIRDALGRRTGSITTVEDISKRKAAEEAMTGLYRQLLENQHRMERTQTVSLVMALHVGLDGTWQKLPPTFCQFLGYCHDELIGRPFKDVTYPDDYAADWNGCQQLIKGQIQSFELEKRFIRKDGTITWGYINCSIVSDDAGRPVHFLTYVRDINAQKRAEADAAEAKREAERAREAAEYAASELSRSNQDLQQFAYVASHDLQEPLRMVTGFLSLLQKHLENVLDSNSRQYIGYAVDGAVRMQRLINDLLKYSRVNSRAFNPQQRVELRLVVEEACRNLQLSIDEAAAVIAHDDLPLVAGDATQLVQVFQNLIGNAIKFRKHDVPPEIAIGASPKGQQWLLWVKDNGIGIPADETARIFQVFQRLHSRQAYPGTGIGLAVVKKIVEAHGGQVWVESQPGRGSTFFFTLSAVAVPQEQPLSAK